MSTKFDLERFKAGDVAIDVYGLERIYLATAPNGNIVTWDLLAEISGTFKLIKLENWTMKPKEEWTLVSRMNKNRDVYSSKQEAEDDCSSLAFWEAVKIIRE